MTSVCGFDNIPMADMNRISFHYGGTFYRIKSEENVDIVTHPLTKDQELPALLQSWNLNHLS